MSRFLCVMILCGHCAALGCSAGEAVRVSKAVKKVKNPDFLCRNSGRMPAPSGDDGRSARTRGRVAAEEYSSSYLVSSGPVQ